MDFTKMKCDNKITNIQQFSKAQLEKETIAWYDTQENAGKTPTDEQIRAWRKKYAKNWNKNLKENTPQIKGFIKKCRSPMLHKISSVGKSVATNLAKNAAQGTASLAYNFLSGAKNMVTDVLRFMISQYFVTIAGMSIAFYILFYSFFGIAYFSKLGIIESFSEISNYIQKTSSNNYMERCGIESQCMTTWDWLYSKISWVYHKAIQIMFKHLYMGSIITVLFFASFKYVNTDQITSSKQLKLSLMFITISFAILVILMYILIRLFSTRIISTFRSTAQKVKSTARKVGSYRPSFN